MTQSSAIFEFEGGYYRVGERLLPFMEMLARGIARDILKEAMLVRLGVDSDSVDALAFFRAVLEGQGLGVRDDGDFLQLETLKEAKKSREKRDQAIKARITLLPERWVVALSSWLRGFFHPAVAVASCLFLAMAFAVFVEFGSADELTVLFRGGGKHAWDAQSSLLLAIIMVSSYIAHELGHSAAAASCGVRPGRVGFGFYWMFPVFFSDVTRVWKASRWERVRVDVGGIYFQGLVVALLMVVSVCVDARWSSVLSSAIFFNLLSIWLSINPMMKYDGYWVVADALDEPALSRLSRARLVQQIRRLVFLKRPRGGTQRHESRAIGLFAWLSLGYLGVFCWMMCAAAINAFHALVGLGSAMARGAYLDTDTASLALRAVPLLFLPWVLWTSVKRLALFVREVAVATEPQDRPDSVGTHTSV